MRNRMRHPRRDLIGLVVGGLLAGFALATANLDVAQGWAALLLGLGVASVAYALDRFAGRDRSPDRRQGEHTDDTDVHKLTT